MNMQQQNNINCLSKARQIFDYFTSDVQNNRASQMAIRRALKKYQVKNMKITNITPLRARRMYESLQSKYQTGLNASNSWLQNQRRIFIWCLICYLHKQELQIAQMTKQNFEYLHTMFPNKQLELIKFQTYSLVKKGNRNQGWQSQQDKILTNIIYKNKLISENVQWSNISKQFFAATNQKYFRSSKQCRQRWLNHLDPNKTKGKWQNLQDIIVLKQVLKNGKKWSKIAHLLQDKKNQHMVKNRYKSLIHKMQKKTKAKKIKESKLIQMIIQELENQSQAQQQENLSQDIRKSKENDINQQNNDHQYSDQKIEQSEKCQENSVGIANRLRKKSDRKVDGMKEIEHQGWREVRQNRSQPIIIESVQSKHKSNGNMQQQNVFALDNAGEHVNGDAGQWNQRQVPDIRNQIEFFGPGGTENNNNQFFDRIFQNANTPLQNNNRMSSIMLDARSPGFLMSPFQPGGWTPTIFFVEDAQGQVSPQVNFGNFCSKFTNDFHKFINIDNNYNNNNNNNSINSSDKKK